MNVLKINIKIIPIPGVSAVSVAVSISGFSDQFILLWISYLIKNRQVAINELDQIFKYLMVHLFFLYLLKKVNKVIPELKTFFSGREILCFVEKSQNFMKNILEQILMI